MPQGISSIGTPCKRPPLSKYPILPKLLWSSPICLFSRPATQTDIPRTTFLLRKDSRFVRVETFQRLEVERRSSERSMVQPRIQDPFFFFSTDSKHPMKQRGDAVVSYLVFCADADDVSERITDSLIISQ